MVTYKVSKKADEDLKNIWNYTSKNWSKEQSNKYIKIIVLEFNKISKHPGLGRNYSKIRLDYFGLKVKSHIIFYKNSNLNEMEIIRILHQKMDLRKRILE